MKNVKLLMEIYILIKFVIIIIKTHCKINNN